MIFARLLTSQHGKNLLYFALCYSVVNLLYGMILVSNWQRVCRTLWPAAYRQSFWQSGQWESPEFCFPGYIVGQISIHVRSTPVSLLLDQRIKALIIVVCKVSLLLSIFKTLQLLDFPAPINLTLSCWISAKSSRHGSPVHIYWWQNLDLHRGITAVIYTKDAEALSRWMMPHAEGAPTQHLVSGS